MPISEIIDDFSVLEDWEDRYRYVIELGKGLEPLADAERTEANRVRGCASQVWLHFEPDSSHSPPRLRWRGDSDALIVKGLVALTLTYFNGKTASEAVASDAVALFRQLGLADHLTPQRSNGLRAMVERIRHDAASLL